MPEQTEELATFLIVHAAEQPNELANFLTVDSVDSDVEAKSRK